jgi:hypothetical protein
VVYSACVTFSNIQYSGLAVKHEPQNDRFLETLINNRKSWENEKEFAKNFKKDGTRKKP